MSLRRGGREPEAFQQSRQNRLIGRRETFSQTFLIDHGTQFSVPFFVAVSGNHGGNVQVVDGVLSFHEQEINPSTWWIDTAQSLNLERVETITLI